MPAIGDSPPIAAVGRQPRGDAPLKSPRAIATAGLPVAPGTWRVGIAAALQRDRRRPARGTARVIDVGAVDKSRVARGVGLIERAQLAEGVVIRERAEVVACVVGDASASRPLGLSDPDREITRAA